MIERSTSGIEHCRLSPLRGAVATATLLECGSHVQCGSRAAAPCVCGMIQKFGTASERDAVVLYLRPAGGVNRRLAVAVDTNAANKSTAAHVAVRRAIAVPSAECMRGETARSARLKSSLPHPTYRPRTLIPSTSQAQPLHA